MYYFASTGIVNGGGAQTILSIENSGVSPIILLDWDIQGVPISALAAAGPFQYRLRRCASTPSGGTSLVVAQSDPAAGSLGVVIQESPSNPTFELGELYATSPGTVSLLALGGSRAPPSPASKDINVVIPAGGAVAFHTSVDSSLWRHWCYVRLAQG